MTTILLFILLVIIAVVAMTIVNQSRAELGSKVEDVLLEQARVAELKAELERAEVEEREELTALRLEMQILEKENAKNVLTLEKELTASGLKGKDAEDALRKELEETRLAEQVKVAAIQLQLDKAKTQEQTKVKSIQFELDKSQARISLMEANVEKLKNKPVAEIADLKKKLSEANLFTKDLQTTMKKKTTESSEATKELKAIQDELNTLKKIEADKRATLQNRLGDSTDTIEDLEEEIGYLKNQAAIYASEKAAARKAAAEKAAADKAAAEKAAIEKAAADKAAAEKAAIEKIAADKAAAEKAAIEKVAAIDVRPDSVKEFTNPEKFTSSAPFKPLGNGRLRPGPSGYPYSQFITKEKGGVEPGIPKGAVDECQAKCKTDPTCPGIAMERYGDDAINCMTFRKQTGKASSESCVYPPFGGECVHGKWSGEGRKTYWRGTRTRSNMWARPESSWFGTPTPDPDDFSGYTDNGNGFCKSGQLFSSPAYALLNPGESRTKAPSFDAPLYKEYAKRGQDKCDADPKCNHVTVWRNAGYRLYDTDNCADKHDPSGSNRSWKKYGNGNVDPALRRAAEAKAAAEKAAAEAKARAELEAKMALNPDSTKESANPEEFTSSAPFKHLGKWRLGGTFTGYEYNGFKTKSKVKELAVDECQAACKKDPTCPGIAMHRYADDSIECMAYRKHSGNASNDLCVYPPFKTDDYKCVYDLPGDSPGLYWRGTRTTSTASIEAAPKAKAAAEDKLEVVRLKEELKKRGLDTTGLKADLVARLKEAVLGKTDSVRESAIPETFTSSVPFKPLGKWRLDPGPSGYPYSQFITKSKVKELAVDECQAKCKKDPTCPGISMERYGDGAINCMTYRKQLGNASNELCVYPPFGDDCVRGLGGDSPGTYWRGTRTTSTASVEVAAEKAAADKAFAKEQAAICSERDVTGKPMSTKWQVFGKCQPDPKDPRKGRKLLQKGYIDHGGKVTGVRGKCARFVKFEECSQDCEYKSGSYLSPNGWFGWMGGTGTNKDAGLVVSRHKVIYPAIGKSKTCCRQLGCPNDCIDPPPGEYIHKDRGVVINSDKLPYGYNDRCDAWGNACHVDKDVWNMFKGRFNKKAEMKKKYGAKFPQLGGACAMPNLSPGQYAKDNETKKLYYYG